MFYFEHEPPHFHAQYEEFNAQISITTGEIMNGTLPSRVLSLISEWIELHRDELIKNWHLIQSEKKPEKIEPLR